MSVEIVLILDQGRENCFCEAEVRKMGWGGARDVTEKAFPSIRTEEEIWENESFTDGSHKWTSQDVKAQFS